MAGVKIRPVRPGEYPVAGELVVDAYRSLNDVDDEFYEPVLRDIEGRFEVRDSLGRRPGTRDRWLRHALDWTDRAERGRRS